MKKYVSHAWYAGGVKEFDTETGSISSAPNKEWGKTDFGSVWRQNGKYYVFHRDEISLILQQGENVWRVTPEFKAELQAFVFFRNFKIKRNGKTVLSVWYKPKGMIFWLIDPTYDYLDAESDDFFLYVKNMWEYWKNRPYSEFKQNLTV